MRRRWKSEKPLGCIEVIEVPITGDMKLHADSKAQQIPKDLSNTIKDGRFDGCLGEVVFLKGLPGSVSLNTWSWDIIYKTYKIEIKTQYRTVKPKDNYSCSIPWSSTHQTPELYVWVSLFRHEKAFICGYITPNLFYDKAEYIKKGEEEGDNLFVERKGSYKIHMSDLWSIEGLLNCEIPRKWPRED